MSNFSFKPVTKDNNAVIYCWLDEPHITTWFHGEGLRNTKEGIQKFVEKDCPQWDAWIGFIDGEPFSFFMVSTIESCQECNITNSLYKWIELDKYMITLDLLIGNKTYLGKGLAVSMIKQFLIYHYNDADIVFIDPECTNTKAIHVYEKVGFKKIDQFIATWYPVPHFLMRLERLKK